MTEATQGSPAATYSNGAASRLCDTGARSASDPYSLYKSGGFATLQEYLDNNSAANGATLGIGTNNCILTDAVKNGDVKTVELLCDRFSASVLQRTLHLDSASKSLMDQVIECNATGNPALALEILKKLCNTCASECAKQGQKFGAVARDLIQSLLGVTSQSQHSDIASYAADVSWEYSAISDATELQEAQDRRRQESEQYLQEVESAHARSHGGSTHTSGASPRAGVAGTRHTVVAEVHRQADSDTSHDSIAKHDDAQREQQTENQNITAEQQHTDDGGATESDAVTAASAYSTNDDGADEQHKPLENQRESEPSGPEVQQETAAHKSQYSAVDVAGSTEEAQRLNAQEGAEREGTDGGAASLDSTTTTITADSASDLVNPSNDVDDNSELEEVQQGEDEDQHLDAEMSTLSSEEADQLHNAVTLDIDTSVDPTDSDAAVPTRKAASSKISVRPPVPPRRAKVASQRPGLVRTTHHDFHTKSAEHGAGGHGQLGSGVPTASPEQSGRDFVQFAESAGSSVGTVVVELKRRGAPVSTETFGKISATLKSLRAGIKDAKEYLLSDTPGSTGKFRGLLVKIKVVLTKLLAAIRDLLRELGTKAKGLFKTQVAKLTTVRDTVADKVQKVEATLGRKSKAPLGDSEGMVPPAKRCRVATSTAPEYRAHAPVALCNEVLAAAKQGKLAGTLAQHLDVLGDPEVLYGVLSHRDTASRSALGLCVESQNIKDITSAVRTLVTSGNPALSAVLAYHLTQRGEKLHDGQSIIQRIISAAARSSDASVAGDVKDLVAEIIGKLCPSSGGVAQRLLAGHVALAALQAGSEDILTHAMTVAAIPEGSLVHNPTQDAMVASVTTWIENVDDVQLENAIRVGMSLLKSSGKVSSSATQDMVARCPRPSTAVLVYNIACELGIIDPTARCGVGAQAYAIQYELVGALSALRSAMSKISSTGESAGLRNSAEKLAEHLNAVFTDVAALTSEQWVHITLQLIPRVQALTTKVQHICSDIASGVSPKESVVTPVVHDAQQISQMIRDVVSRHPAQSRQHTLQTFDMEGAALGLGTHPLAAAYGQLYTALESAHNAYKGPFRNISIENFANSLSDAKRDVVSAMSLAASADIGPVDAYGLDINNATRKIADSISENPHIVFCDQQVIEEMLHAAALLELATTHKTLDARRDADADRTQDELVSSFREKAADAYYHITQALNIVGERGKVALRGAKGSGLAAVRDSLVNAGGYVKRAVASISNNMRVTTVLEAEAWLQYGKNELSRLGTRIRDKSTLLHTHLQEVAHRIAEHVTSALASLRLATQILKDIVVYAIRRASGRVRVGDSLSNSESSLLDVIPTIHIRIDDAATALARKGKYTSQLREALHSADSVLAEISSALSSGKRDFLDGNAPHLVLHACAREISQHDFSATPQLSSKMDAVLIDLEGVVGRLVDIKAQSTLEQSPAVEVSGEFVRNSLKTLAYTLQVRSAVAGVRAVVPDSRLAEIAQMLPASDGQFVITSGADLAVAFRAVIEEHHISHVKNAPGRVAPIVALSEISKAVEKGGAQRSARTGTDSAHAAAVPVKFIYNALVACSRAMQLSTAIDGIKARASSDMLTKIMVAGLPTDARHSHMVSDANVISAMMDNLIRWHRGCMHQDAVHTARNSLNRGCLDLVREVINQKSTFDLDKAVPAHVYSTEPRVAFLEGVVEQALVMRDGGHSNMQEGVDGRGGRTVSVGAGVANGIVVAVMSAIQDAVTRDRRGRAVPPGVPVDVVERIASEAVGTSKTVNLSAQMVYDAFEHLEREMLKAGTLAVDTKIGDELVQRVAGIAMHIATQYTGSDIAARDDRHALLRRVEKMATSLYIETQKEHCRSAVRVALQEMQQNVGDDQHLVREAAKYAIAFITRSSSEHGVPVSDCVSLMREIANTLSAGDATARPTIEKSLLSSVARLPKQQGVVVISEQCFADLFTAIRDSVKSAGPAVSTKSGNASIAASFAGLTDDMIQHMAQGVTAIHSVALDFWKNGTVVEESSRVSAREAAQHSASVANSADNVPLAFARTALAAAMSAVNESVVIANRMEASRVTEQQIMEIVDAELDIDQSQSPSEQPATVRITSSMVHGMLAKLGEAIRAPDGDRRVSGGVHISEDLYPTIAKITVSAIKDGITASDSTAKTLLDRLQRSIHTACGTAITLPTAEMGSHLARNAIEGSTPALVLDLAAVFAGLNDAKSAMEGMIAAGNKSSNLNAAQKERIRFAISETESLMERVSTSNIRIGAERVQDDIRLIVSTLANMHHDANLTLSDSCTVSAVRGTLVAQLGLVEACAGEHAKVAREDHREGRAAPVLVEVDPAAASALQQNVHISPSTQSGTAYDKSVVNLGRATRLLGSVDQLLSHNGTYNTLQGRHLMRHLEAAGHSLREAQRVARLLLLYRVADGRDAESVQQQEKKFQDAVARSQECLLTARLVAAPLSQDSVLMLNGLCDAVTLLQETQRRDSQRVLEEGLASQISRMVSLARSATSSVHGAEVAETGVSGRRAAVAHRQALMSLGAVECLLGFLDDARAPRDARLIAQVSKHLENCKNSLQAQLSLRRSSTLTGGAQQNTSQHCDALVQVAMHAVHIAHDLIREHGRNVSQNDILNGWQALATDPSGSMQPNEVRLRAAALVDVYEAMRDAGALVSETCVETGNNGFAPRKSASQVLCESVHASGARVTGAPQHQEVDRELTILAGDAVGAKALLNQVFTKLASYEDHGIAQLRGNIEYATDTMLNRNRGIAASEEVAQLLGKIAVLTKSGLKKLATAAEAASSISTKDLAKVDGALTQQAHARPKAGLAPARDHTQTVAQWFRTITDMSSYAHGTAAPGVSSTSDSGVQQSQGMQIADVSGKLKQVVQLLYGYGLGTELDTVREDIVKALNNAVGMLPLITKQGSCSVPDALHPNTVSMVFRLEGIGVPQDDIDSLVAKFEVIASKLSLLTSLTNLQDVAKKLKAIQDSDAKVQDAAGKFDGIVRQVSDLTKSVIEKIDDAVPVRGLEALGAYVNRVVKQELRNVATSAITRSYERMGLRGLRESIESVRGSLGRQFVVADHTVLQNMFGLKDIDSAEMLCSYATLPPEPDRVARVIATVANALRSNLIDPVRALSCLDGILKNSLALGTLHTDEMGMYMLHDADITDMLIAFYEHNDEAGVRFLHSRCGSCIVNGSKIESAVLARLANNASLNATDTLLLELYERDIFTDPDVSIKRCQDVGASFLEIYLDRAYGARGISVAKEPGTQQSDIGTAIQEEETPDFFAKLSKTIPEEVEDRKQQPWHVRLWQWVSNIVGRCYAVINAVITLFWNTARARLRGITGAEKHAPTGQQHATDISSARSTGTESGKGAPDAGHHRGTDEQEVASGFFAKLSKTIPEEAEDRKQQPWYVRLWQRVSNIISIIAAVVASFLNTVVQACFGKATNAKSGAPEEREAQQEQVGVDTAAQAVDEGRTTREEVVEAAKSSDDAERSAPAASSAPQHSPDDGAAHPEGSDRQQRQNAMEAAVQDPGDGSVPSSTITDPEVEEVSAVQSRRGSVQQ
ncbi:hypothetical protein ACIS_00611 [Anaplasma centrale str. Israel]|uniref:Uncharacterized protein n=1 Tax=Anaplasma centrale (strain Israel) TaxID=574556 RepID=D1AUH2_ANACI|nr:hypothetical protein [Anaplasma centrale]ACZ49200.1 hypothetical protein ACIS_00611 [Anaplasma centrale str. Israel]